ncbi:MAG: glycerol kinase, partial [Anaerovoracaceae bacterium]
LLDIPPSMLPEPKASSCIYGETDDTIFGGPIKIGGAAGDQQAALFGQTSFEAGEGKNTYGTGCFLLMNTGETPVFSRNGLVTTIAWGLSGKELCLEGSVFVCGAHSGLERDRYHREILGFGGYAMSVSIYGPGVVPAFVGQGLHWDPCQRSGAGDNSRRRKNHLVRAT